MSVTSKLNNFPVWERGDKVIFANLREVASSNVDRIGWPCSGEPLMIVRFKSGETYGYLGVSRQRAVAAAHAVSPGRYLNLRVKPFYKAVKIVG